MKIKATVQASFANSWLWKVMGDIALLLKTSPNRRNARRVGTPILDETLLRPIQVRITKAIRIRNRVVMSTCGLIPYKFNIFC